MDIREYRRTDEAAVVSLWQAAGLTRPWNDPHRDIARKQTVQSELFLVGLEAARLVGTAMAGYDGHRGWIYYLAVDEAYRRRGFGAQLVREAERRLAGLGCPKVNLMVRDDNDPSIAAFYTELGYNAASVQTLGRRLAVD